MNHSHLKSRARSAFLRGRVRAARAELGLASLLVVAAFGFADEASVVFLPAALLLGLTAALAVYGRVAGRAVLPALLLGVIPLACSLSAQHLGHACTAGGCMSLCVPLCSSGGLVAGLLLGRQSRHSARPLVAWLSGGALVVAAGALGCVCVGAGGVVGMSLGVLSSAGLLAWPVRSVSSAV